MDSLYPSQRDLEITLILYKFVVSISGFSDRRAVSRQERIFSSVLHDDLLLILSFRLDETSSTVDPNNEATAAKDHECPTYAQPCINEWLSDQADADKGSPV